MALLIMAFCSMFHGEILYLKSGAIHKCEDYRIEGNRVVLLPEGQFTLSYKMVDWEKTEQKKKERKARADWRTHVMERLQELNLSFEGDISKLADEIRGLEGAEIFSMAQDKEPNLQTVLFGLAGDFGCDEAWYRLGALFLRKGSSQYELAANWIEKAATAGIVKAQYTLGLIYYEGHGRKKDEDEALKWFTKAEAAGDEEAGKFMARIYSTSSHNLKNNVEGLRWLEVIANEGNRDAQLKLGRLYRKGYEIPADYDKAEKWLAAAAENGTREARHELGLFYFENRQAYEKAREWLELAAADKVTDAQVKLAWLHQEGLGVPKDRKIALTWLRKAAELGSTEAQFMVGVYFDQGLGMRPDPEEAVRWYRLAAEKNHAPSQTNLGLAYELGKGVEPDTFEALRWYRLAAAQNYATAQVFLAICYRSGTGVERDMQKALEWYGKAAKQGHAAARLAIQSYDQWSSGQIDIHQERLEAELRKMQEKFQKERVTYTVISPNSGKEKITAHVHYTNGKGVATYIENATLPWSKTLMVDKGDSLRVSATSNKIGADIRVTISVNNVARATAESREQLASSTAVYKIKRRHESGTPQDL